jgi:hypothetical protein
MDNKVILRFQIMRVYLIYPLLTKAGIFAVIFCTLFLICFSSGFVHADNPIVEQKKANSSRKKGRKNTETGRKRRTKNEQCASESPGKNKRKSRIEK